MRRIIHRNVQLRAVFVTGSENLDPLHARDHQHLVATPYIPTHCPSSPYIFRHAAS